MHTHMQCPITEDGFKSGYSALVEDMGIFDPETGQSCSLEDSDLQGQSLKRGMRAGITLFGSYIGDINIADSIEMIPCPKYNAFPF